MRVVLLCGVLLVAACAERIAPSVEEGTNLVKVEQDPWIAFPDPPQKVIRAEQLGFEEALPPKKVQLVVAPTLVTEPPGATQITELREVHLNVDLEGVDPSELTVEFTTPEGTVFDRQVNQLNGTRYHKQQASFSMPVAGTLISSMHLVGTWRARVFLAGVEISSMEFEVTP